jgi:hypothetical protein
MGLMTNESGVTINLRDLRRLYANDASARALLDHLASRERNWSSLTVDRIHANVVASGYPASRTDIVNAFRELEAFGCGTFKAGRRGWPSRFEWAVQMVDVGRAAAGKTERVDQISREDVEPEEEEAHPSEPSLQHTFRLRADYPVAFELPANISTAEAERLAAFIKTLPFSG